MAVYDTVENKRTWMTERTLLSLRKTVDWKRHRLIVVDNGSCEATQRLFADVSEVYATLSASPFTLLSLPENVGTAKAINLAWHHREAGEHCIKMDNDVRFHQAEWADWMEDVFERDPTIGIVGLKRNDLMETPHTDDPQFKSTLRMLPHELGQRWLVVEEVVDVMGTCQGFSSDLLDKIGYLTQPGLYGFDDSLASARANVAGFKRCLLCGFEITHLDPGDGDYAEWKRVQANRYWPAYRTMVALLDAGVMDPYDDGGFDV